MSDIVPNPRDLAEVLKGSAICVWSQLLLDQDDWRTFQVALVVDMTDEQFVKSSEEEYGSIVIHYWRTLMDIYLDVQKLEDSTNVFDEAIGKILDDDPLE